MNQQDRDADERVRQLCLKAVAANSDEELEAALMELREAIGDSMSRARERMDNLAILESQLKPAA